MNVAPTWGIALLGTTRADGSPRISPLCVYLTDERLLVTIEGVKERDLQRDDRYFLHTYWSEGQDEFAVSGRASAPIEGADRQRLDGVEPRLAASPVVRELDLASAHSVIYRNFPTPETYAEVTSWKPGAPARRWTRDEQTLPT